MGDTQLVASIRDMLRDDLTEVMEVERASYDEPWNTGEMVYQFNKANGRGFVAEFGGRVVGFLLYTFERNFFCVLDIAVDPEFRRLGVGSLLLHKLMAKLRVRRQRRIGLMVGGECLGAHHFFRSNGFLATDVIHARHRKADTDEDAYAFEYDMDAAPGIGVAR